MNAEHAWIDEEEPPGEELGYWEDEELTADGLVCWSGPVPAADDARAADARSVVDAAEGVAWPRAERSVPDLVAAVLAASGDPSVLTDADLVRSLAGWHAVAARAAGRELRATEELLRRRRPRAWDRRAGRAERAWAAPDALPDADSPGRVMPAVVPSREAAAEIALALTATGYAADAQVTLAADLSRRLPASFAELDAGRADLRRVQLLAEATRFLSDEDAGKVDALLAPRLGQLTTGDLRDKARKAVFSIDAAAADRRREHAERKARFALYGNDDATATAAIERMPAQLGAAVKARVNAIARAARAAGMTGPMALLEAKVATGLLLDTLPHIPPPAGEDPGPGGPPGDPWDGGWPAGWFPAPGAPDDSAGDAPADFADCNEPGPAPDDGKPADAEPEESQPGAMAWPLIPVQAGAAGPGCLGVPAWLRPKDPGRIRLLVPWRSLTGLGPEPGELSWTGPITPAQARELAAAAAADPHCTWRLITTDEHGRALAITTLRDRRGTRAGPPGPPGLVSEVTITISQGTAAALASQRGDWTAQAPRRLADLLAQAIPAANLAAAQAAARAAADRAAGGCAHTMEAPGYRIPDRLRRWVTTRDRTCRNPVCRQPATRCDQDHTVPYDHGGRTCSCDLGALCRAHHELKQLPGWHLSQDADGTFTWQTPAGLTYRKEPHRYAI